MELTKKVWHDENSEPPKNYLWVKGGKLFKYIEGRWKEVSKKESDGGEGGSGESSVQCKSEQEIIKDALDKNIEVSIEDWNHSYWEEGMPKLTTDDVVYPDAYLISGWVDGEIVYNTIDTVEQFINLGSLSGAWAFFCGAYLTEPTDTQKMYISSGTWPTAIGDPYPSFVPVEVEGVTYYIMSENGSSINDGDTEQPIKKS